MKKLLSFVVAALMIAAMCIVPVSAASYSGGSGTYEDPYLISTADDFIAFIKDCESVIASGSSDQASSFGYQTFYKQTADIDLTGTGFAGTNAASASKYAFGGVYDGAGHTLTANIETSYDGDVSIFPYVTGIVINLKVDGSINAANSGMVQPFRTLGKNGGIYNVYTSVDLYGKTDVNAFACTLYGLATNLYTDGILGGSSNDIFNSLQDGCKSVNVFHNCVRKDGSVVEQKDGSVQNADLNDIVAKFNDAAAKADAVAVLQTFNAGYSADSLLAWEVVDGTIGFVGAAAVETPAETPVETPVETPTETPVETPVETPTETPVDDVTDAPATAAPTTTPDATTATQTSDVALVSGLGVLALSAAAIVCLGKKRR